MRNWGSAMEAWYLYLPRYPGFKPRTVPMSPATPHASPAIAPSGPMGGLQWRSLTKQSCIQLAQEKGLILLSKLFISSSRSRQFPAPWTRIRGFFIVFIHVPSSTCLCPLWLWYLLSRILVWHFVRLWAEGQGRTAHPHPFHQLAPSSLPWLLKQTGYVLQLPTQPKDGRGGYWVEGGSKYPSCVNNQDDLAAHLIFCNLISAK